MSVQAHDNFVLEEYRPGRFHLMATLPGKIISIEITKFGGIHVSYLTPKKWWQFWKPNVSRTHFCPHYYSDWDLCPDCCH